MYPAISVILFTTASGVGYGILVLVPVFAIYGVLPVERWLGVTLLIPALGLITLGLLSSTFHLGHPERAWRALSQWKSSWLSREGVAAIVAYVPALVFAYAWIVLETIDGPWVWAGFLTIIAALTTMFTTAMIYRSLKPIPAWATDWTVAGYLTLGLLTGLAIVTAVAAAFGFHPARFQTPALVLTLAAAVIKNAYWKRQTEAWSSIDSGSAIGAPGATVRSVEWPHTEANYVLKEMGYRIARKHAEKLRSLTRFLLLGAPLVCLVILPSIIPMPYLAVLVGVGTLLTLAGVVIERWLFFAEARHVVTLYYGLE
jgi:DMSO reductase anchor subunit